MASKAIVRKGVRVRVPPPAPMYGAATRRRVDELVGLGLSSAEIARCTTVSETTIRRWRGAATPRSGRPGCCPLCLHPPHHPDRYPAEYAYLLGIYLGDGHVTRHKRGVYRLRVSRCGVPQDRSRDDTGDTSGPTDEPRPRCDQPDWRPAVDCERVLQAVAVLVPATWARYEAHASHRARRMATRVCWAVSARSAPRADPLRRLPER